MTRRFAQLLSVALLLVALCVPLAGQQESIEELRARAEQGDTIAQLNLGDVYAIGRQVPQDDAETARWYRLSAEQGN